MSDIAWSLAAVVEQTLVAVRNPNLSVRLLRPLADIDDDLASLNAQFELIENILRKGKRV
jgi:glycosyltransferase A (GT-A) superfamily protein (DUF2064 family)